MPDRFSQSGVVEQRGIDGENRDHGQNVQRGPMVGWLRPNLITIGDASLAALCGFCVGLALALKAALHPLRTLHTCGKTVQRGDQEKSKQHTDGDVDGSTHPLRC